MVAVCGCAVFISQPTPAVLRAALDTMAAVYDVEFESGNTLRYIHKVKDSLDIYFFANTTGSAVNTYAQLRGRFTPELCDPYSGTIAAADHTQTTQSGQDVVRVNLSLPAYRSCFIIASDNTFSRYTQKKIALASPMFYNGTIRIKAVESGILKTWLIAMNGRKIAAWSKPVVGGDDVMFRLPKHCANGVYILRVQCAGERITRKIVHY